jgi:nucleotide-binding universal stress UspA family protein
MPRFTNALVFASGPTDPAVQHATRLAVAQRTTITVADVLEKAPAYLRPLLPREWNLPRQLRAHKTASLERTAARIRRLGIETRIKLLEGAPVQALVREVVRAGHDLLAIAASAPGELQSVGTTAARLVRECPCPTLLARPGRRRRHRVLVAIDPGLGDRRNAAMNALLLETGIAIAEVEKEELDVLHAWNVYDERYLRRQGLRADEMERFVGKAREQAREALTSTIAPYRRHLSAKNIHLERGTPREVVPAFARKHGIELLVIGTVARSGLERHLIGNTAEILLGQMPCSMLVVGPERPRRGSK